MLAACFSKTVLVFRSCSGGNEMISFRASLAYKPSTYWSNLVIKVLKETLALKLFLWNLLTVSTLWVNDNSAKKELVRYAGTHLCLISYSDCSQVHLSGHTCQEWSPRPCQKQAQYHTRWYISLAHHGTQEISCRHQSISSYIWTRFAICKDDGNIEEILWQLQLPFPCHHR